jgi:hypothetical protein
MTVDDRHLAKQLKFKRRTTERLIEREGRLITLTRPAVATSDGAGGYRQGSGTTTIAAQRLYFGGKIPNRMVNVTFQEQTELGELIRNTPVLVGLRTANIREGDHFTIDGLEFVVEFIDEDRTFQIKAECKRYTS